MILTPGKKLQLEIATFRWNCYSDFDDAFATSTANPKALWISFRKGNPMKIAIRHANEEWREPIDKETEHHAEKIEKLLKRYAPISFNCMGTSRSILARNFTFSL